VDSAVTEVAVVAVVVQEVVLEVAVVVLEVVPEAVLRLLSNHTDTPVSSLPEVRKIY
jgi:hypothetical protein